MSAFTGLIRDGKIGKWCKRGAVLIAIAGTVQILLTLYALWGEYHQIQPNGQGPFDPNSFILFWASQLFTRIVTTVFFSLMLYAVGVIIVPTSVPEHTAITYETLDQPDTTPFEGEQESLRIVP